MPTLQRMNAMFFDGFGSPAAPLSASSSSSLPQVRAPAVAPRPVIVVVEDSANDSSPPAVGDANNGHPSHSANSRMRRRPRQGIWKSSTIEH